MKNILLVEDDKKLTVALSLRLKTMGFNVATAPDAMCAMDKVIRHRPDAVLIDINLPGGDGFMVADGIRATGQLAATPLIFITASRQEGLRDRASQYGLGGFLEKPFGADALEKAVVYCLGCPSAYTKTAN